MVIKTVDAPNRAAAAAASVPAWPPPTTTTSKTDLDPEPNPEPNIVTLSLQNMFHVKHLRKTFNAQLLKKPRAQIL
jgi:cell division septation protein DedD